MSIKICLVYFYFICVLDSIIDDFVSKYDVQSICEEIKNRFGNLKYLKTKGRVMDFLLASEITRSGGKVTRKSWDKGHYMYWDAKYKCMLADNPYGKQDKHLDTSGYLYICEGDDVEASDWEKFA